MHFVFEIFCPNLIKASGRDFKRDYVRRYSVRLDTVSWILSGTKHLGGFVPVGFWICTSDISINQIYQYAIFRYIDVKFLNLSW